MSYKSFDVEDFASDPDFRKWVLNPDDDSNKFWENWLIAHPDKKPLIAKAVLLVKALCFEEESFSGDEKESLLGEIKKTISSQVSNKTIPIYPHRSESPYANRNTKSTSKILYRLAAVFVGALAVAAFLLINIKEKITDSAVAESSLIIKEINKGQKMRIFLPDGSIVFLNSASKLTYPEKFTGNEREVQLSGEAFFEVAGDPASPFIVKTDGLTTKVYGTSFNVSSYPDAEVISVSLVSGKVMVSRDGSSEIIPLKPGESAELNKRTGTMVREQFDYKKTVLWKDGIIYFWDSSIHDVIEKLEQWYGVAIHVNKIPESLKPIRGSFDNEYLNNVLMSLGHTVNFKYRISGNEVFIDF
jgi:transmembrane sensor